MTEKPPKVIALLGATGFTGQLIAAELAKRQMPFIIAGRNAAKLAALQSELNSPSLLKTMVATPDNPASLAELFKPPTALVINCAGPFTDLGEPVVKAALEAGIHYLDITGEQVYIARMLDRYHATATEKGCLVIPACGFEYAVGNWAVAQAVEGLEPLDHISVAIAVKNISTSRGTRLSALKLLGNAGYGWKNRQRTAHLTAHKSKVINFPPPFGKRRTVWIPSGELVTIPRHIKVQNMDGYISLPGIMPYISRLTFFMLPLTSGLLTFFMGSGKNYTPDPHNRKPFEWVVQVEAISSKGNKTVSWQGQDVYGLTALITAYAAGQILAGNYPKAGVLGVAHALDYRPALEMLQQAGVKILDN
jgi:short subunit dehydrogenase-like uncharacterized protein